MLLHPHHSRHWQLLCALLLAIVCGLMLGVYSDTLSTKPARMTDTHTSTPRMADCHLQNNHDDAEMAAKCCEWLCSTHAVLPVSLVVSISHGNPHFERPLNQAYIQAPQMAYRRAIERPPRLSA